VTPDELMIHVAGVFEKLGISHAVTGSLASMYYGEMRTTLTSLPTFTRRT